MMGNSIQQFGTAVTVDHSASQAAVSALLSFSLYTTKFSGARSGHGNCRVTAIEQDDRAQGASIAPEICHRCFRHCNRACRDVASGDVARAQDCHHAPFADRKFCDRAHNFRMDG
jgi:hypothetical protein